MSGENLHLARLKKALEEAEDKGDAKTIALLKEAIGEGVVSRARPPVTSTRG